MAESRAESDGTATNNTYTLLPKRLEPLEMTNSPFPGSLAVLMDSREECCGYAVVSSNKVTLVRWMNGQIQHNVVESFSNRDDNCSGDGLTLVTGVNWCYLVSGETLLVITSFAGFTIYNAGGTLKIFQYRITHNDQTTASCVKGITSVGNSICIGTSEGYILIFSINNEHGVDYQQQLEEHKYPINCLTSSKDGRIASGDEKGTIILWNNPNRTNDCTILYNEASSNQFGCLHMCWHKDLIIAGYSNGILRIYNTKLNTLIIEVSAHSRLISGLAVASATGLILTVSEDSTVCVWQLTNIKTPQISLVHNRVIENSLLSGGVLCDQIGSMFAVIRYSDNTIMEFGIS